MQDRIGAWARVPRPAGTRRRALKVARFGDNMRQVAVTEGDKVEAQLRLGVSVNGYGVGELVDAVQAVPDAAVQELVDAYAAEYDLAPELRADGERHESLRDAARIEAGLRSFLEAGGFMAFTDTFEDLGELHQLPGIAVQRLLADGYGFGAEGDWKTAALVRVAKVMSTGLEGGTSFMEDYTYHLAPGGPEGPRRPHARGLPVDRRRPAVVRDPPAVDRRQGGSGAPRLHRRSRAGGRRRPARPRRPVPARR